MIKIGIFFHFTRFVYLKNYIYRFFFVIRHISATHTSHHSWWVFTNPTPFWTSSRVHKNKISAIKVVDHRPLCFRTNYKIHNINRFRTNVCCWICLVKCKVTTCYSYANKWTCCCINQSEWCDNDLLVIFREVFIEWNAGGGHTIVLLSQTKHADSVASGQSGNEGSAVHMHEGCKRSQLLGVLVWRRVVQ